MAVKKVCPSCDEHVETEIFYEQLGAPIHSCLMVDSYSEAMRFPTGDLRLVFCSSCGFIWNEAFESERMRYSAAYEETQVFSPHFRRFQSELVDRWVDRYQLTGCDLLEIGCGKGDFLVEMCRRGQNRGLGIDPSYRPERTDRHAAAQTTFLRELYAPKHADISVDFVCCRHTLEHISQPRQFMKLSRRHAARRGQTAGHHGRDDNVLGNGLDHSRDLGRDSAIVAFELPDVERVLDEGAFWDLYYEHCSYFSLGSLGRLFRSVQLEILDLYKDYSDQYLIIEAKPVEAEPPPHAAEESVADLAALVERFRRHVDQRLKGWRHFVAQKYASGKRVAVWGSGSKAVAFLSRLGFRDEICCVVDINPHKHGKFLAGVGHQIVPPDRLRTLRPDTVIAMNPVYLNEIGADLRAMQIEAELVAL